MDLTGVVGECRKDRKAHIWTGSWGWVVQEVQYECLSYRDQRGGRVMLYSCIRSMV